MSYSLRVIKNIEEMQSFSVRMKGRGKTIGFVPTMGALHEGHLSLIAATRKKCDVVVVSIFVNPIQFGPKEDLASYPRDLKSDQQKLQNAEVDVLFHPSADKMYPHDFSVVVEFEQLSKKLCGKSRVGHFRGVATVVTKLLNIVQPDSAFFGQKDYQQLLVIKKLVADLNLPVKVLGLPTVREYDGLAMSSRNQHLTERERESATILYKALQLAKETIQSGEKNSHAIILRLRALFGTAPGVHLDYVAIVDPETLEDQSRVGGKVLIALAAHVGKTRLIDNLIVE